MTLPKLSKEFDYQSFDCVIIDTEFEKTDIRYKKLFDFYAQFGFEILDEEKSARRLYLPVAEIPE